MVDELKTIFDLTEGSAPALTDYALTGEDPAGNHVLRRTTWQSIKNLFLSGVTTLNNNGWIPVFETCTYVSANSFTITGDYSSRLAFGDKFRMVQTTNKYSYVLSSVYSSPNTTITVIGDSLTNAAIVAPTYSHEVSPFAFTHWFNYTPTGIAASNVTLSGRFSVVGRTCKVQFVAYFTGGITFTTMPTLPITASSSILSGVPAEESVVGVASYLDTGTSHNPIGLVVTVLPSATTFDIRSSAVGSTLISATSPITWANGDVIHAQFEYEI